MPKQIKRKRITVDLSEEDYKSLEKICSGKSRKTMVAEIRKGIRWVIAVKNKEIFLSTDPTCRHKVPSSIL